MDDNTTWLLTLIYEGGVKVEHVIPDKEAVFLREKTEWGQGSHRYQTRILHLLSGNRFSVSLDIAGGGKLGIKGSGLKVLLLKPYKGNPLDDASHYDNPLN